MNKKILTGVLAVLLAAGTGYISYTSGYSKGQQSGKETAEKEQEALHMLNRSELEHLDITKDKFYVIGHRSPDADTVMSAIACARLMNALGYHAEPALSEEADLESLYILEQAGVEVPPVLDDVSGEDILLVDHSEYSQAAEGMRDAHIIGIIDHHGVGSVTTGNVVYYNARPIGATATIIWLNYLNYGVEIDKSTAHILLGAILSDTANLTTTYTTSADKEAVAALSRICGVEDTTGFYKAIYAEKLSYKGMSDLDILLSDYKSYEASGVKFGIALANAIDEEHAAELAKRLAKVLPEGHSQKDVELMFAEVSIREEGVKIDYIVCADEHSKEVFEAAFPDYDEFDGTSYIFRQGLGRKTKLVPGLTDFLGQYPHE